MEGLINGRIFASENWWGLSLGGLFWGKGGGAYYQNLPQLGIKLQSTPDDSNLQGK